MYAYLPQYISSIQVLMTVNHQCSHVVTSNLTSWTWALASSCTWYVCQYHWYLL